MSLVLRGALCAGMTLFAANQAIAADVAAIIANIQQLEDDATFARLGTLPEASLIELEQIVQRAQRLIGGAPSPGTDRWAAVCHIDDDPQFDFDQVVIGEIKGATVEQIEADCAAIARARYRDQGSSGLKDVRYVGQPQPTDRFAAICHVDDDPQFDFDQFVVGELRGANVAEIERDCAAIARARFQANGSSGLNNVVYVGQPQPTDRFVASCHIDDDPQFDADQFVIGDIRGANIAQIESDCAAIARARFRDQASSGLLNVRPI